MKGPAQITRTRRAEPGPWRLRPLALGLAVLVAFTTSAQATDLIISEYVEGSGNNKYLELYNGTGAAVNLGDYRLRLYANGSATPTNDVLLSGTLASGGTVVYRNSGATNLPGSLVNGAVSFNGDDAIALYKVSTASLVDIFGRIGNDPGTQWTAGTLSTVDRTLVRNTNICAGVTVNPTGTGPGAFTTLGSEWTGHPQDDVSNLGSHIMICGPTVTFATASSSALENVGTAQTIVLNISPAPTTAGTVTITIGGASTATHGTDYTTAPAAAGGTTITLNVPVGATTRTFNVNLIDDLFNEGDETIQFSLTGTTGGLSIGGSASHTFTILDDDNTTTIEFSTLSVTVLESAAGQAFSISIVGTPPHPTGNITVTITNGPGAGYGAGPAGDYTTAPNGSSGTFTIPLAPFATNVSFTVDPQVDGIAEPTETITFEITGVPAGCVIGPNASATLHIGDMDSPPAVFAPGDLAIVGVNANNPCTGEAGDDEVSFFCFKEITYGTEIIITDNGYERCTPGLWGNTEGTVVMRRTGPAIPAGQVVTFRIKGTYGAGNVTAVAPDAGWTCTSIGVLNTSVNLNAGGDQLFFMQGGVWNSGTNGGHNATYTGTLLYAFSTNPVVPWTATCGSPAGNQRSNLPPGVECFSMSPTLASDFNKYVGPITSASQRDWIIRIENQANWDSYGTCAAYVSSGYNWLTAPIMPIIPGAMTHGLWRGSTSTDWFECKNWDDARVPDPATNVVINQTASRNCLVGVNPGLNPGGTAVCASLLLTTSTTTSRLLSVQDNSTLSVGGLFRIQHTGGATNLVATLLGNATLNAGSVELEGGAPGAMLARLHATGNDCVVNVSGDLTIGPGGFLNLQGTPVTTRTLNLGGDFIHTEGDGQFMENQSTLNLVGGGDQFIVNSTPNEMFGHLRVNKTGGDAYLTAPIQVRNSLDLLQGRLFTTSTELLTLLSNVPVLNVSDASFVHGPVKRFGNTDFTFPVGKGSNYRPASLSGITGTNAVAFTTEYFAEDPYVDVGPLALPTTLHHISHCEYWTIDRSAATPNARVTLSWDTPESCVVTPGALTELRVARWTGTNWDDRGNGGTTGNATAGTVSSAAVETVFSPWTLASVTENNPLPIELLSFTAEPGAGQVDLAWSTASERNNAYFTVERGTDALHFDPLLQVPGAGNSHSLLHYTDVDLAPLEGLSYYRLRQTDLDGTSEVSDAVPVFFRGSGMQSLTVLYGEDAIHLRHGFAAGSTVEVLDLTGRLLLRTTITGTGLFRLPTEELARGIYLIRLRDGIHAESTRVSY